MEKVKIIVVEDEILIADNICDALEDLGYEVLEPAISYSEAVQRIEDEQPDIAILDIQLSGSKSGIDLAKKINESYHFPFIFLTSNADVATVTEAKKVMPPAYLIKPFTREELFTSIEIALFNFSQQKGQAIEKEIIIKEAVFVKDKGVFFKLLFEDILYIKAAHVYVEVVLTNDKKHVLRASLNDFIKKLNNKFVRVHRGYIVNLDFISQIDTTSITINKESIPLGKMYRDNLFKRINII